MQISIAPKGIFANLKMFCFCAIPTMEGQDQYSHAKLQSIVMSYPDVANAKINFDFLTWKITERHI